MIRLGDILRLILEEREGEQDDGLKNTPEELSQENPENQSPTDTVAITQATDAPSEQPARTPVRRKVKPKPTGLLTARGKIAIDTTEPATDVPPPDVNEPIQPPRIHVTTPSELEPQSLQAQPVDDLFNRQNALLKKARPLTSTSGIISPNSPTPIPSVEKPGEKAYEVDFNDFQGFLFEPSYESEHKTEHITRHSDAEFVRQFEEVYQNLPKSGQDRYRTCKSIWQYSQGIHKEPKHIQAEVVRFFNSIGRAFKPQIRPIVPVERGARVRVSQIHQYLSNFNIGQPVDIPVSGFSTVPVVARGFADTDHQSVDDEPRIGVVLRMAPTTNGHVNFLSLYSPNEGLNAEYEVVRYAGPRTRCVDIKRFDTVNKTGDLRRMYVINLEDMGYSPMVEAVNPMSSLNDPVFMHYTEGPLGGWKEYTNQLSEMLRRLKIVDRR
jgi:hypothetical protein